ncbi:Phasin protein [Hoeflea sp. IMCC20628]|uniref:phasin family protein n=1 Tax=Hoeflea sp. IMCC20628 TaxID=1620421 RepID=UPI00063A9F6C|nr:phasin family protein [Hoeflea sp. IMCC20628]AKH99960.1 Phasin protein [Hoeflea sp. IMCC20628]
MTKTTKTSNAKTTAADTSAAHTGAASTNDAKTMIMDAVENLQEKMVAPEAAREFVAQQAATVQARTEAAHEGAAKLNAEAEKAAVSFVGHYANFTKSLIDMTAANVRHAFETVEKVAGAKSLPDALKHQADFLRDSSKANFDRLKDVSETAKASMEQAAATAREAAAKAMNHGNKAA